MRISDWKTCALPISDVEKQDYAKSASAGAADAAFAAAQGAVVGPVQTPLGFAIARVEKITRVPGKTLAEARDALVGEPNTTKSQEENGSGSWRERVWPYVSVSVVAE